MVRTVEHEVTDDKMPNRIMRDGWLESWAIDSLTVHAELFFFRLCLRADDFGRFHAHPQLLKASLFPLKDDVRSADISRWTAECEKAGLIRCYECDSKRFLVILKFNQRRRAESSKFPDPPFDCHMTVTGQSSAPVVGGEVEDEAEGEFGARGAPGGEFPVSVEVALKLAELQPYPKEFVAHTWEKANGRGGRDAQDVPIRKWLSHLATEWKYEAERKAKDANYPKPNKPSAPNRNDGTANAGKAAQYRRVGKVGEV